MIEKIIKNNLVLILILAVSIFFRFYKLGEFFTFNFDEEYQTLLAWEQVKNFHPVWIGVSASNINYYLGPGFIYLTAFLLYITKDPIILAFFGSTLGIMTVFSIFHIGKSIFSQKIGLYAAAFYAGSLFLTFFDRRHWSVTPLSFFCIWLLYFLYKAKTNPHWFIAIVILMGLALHIHLSLLAFWPVVIYIFWLSRKKMNLKIIITSVMGFIAATFPLLIFDLNHNFDNLLMPIRYAQKLFSFSAGEGNLFNGFIQLSNTLTRLWFLKPFTNVQDEIQLGIHGDITKTNIVITLLSLIIILFLFRISFKEEKIRILSLSILSFLAVYLFYPGGVVAYFLLGFFVLFAIAVGIFFSRLPGTTAKLMMLIFLLVNFYSLITTQQEQFGLTTRKKLIQKIMISVKDSSFYLETRTSDKRKYHSAGGWRYLFKAYGKTPAQSHADDFFGWIYPDEISKEKPKLRVIISEYPTKVKEKIISQHREGVYYGYVINNK